jgi:biopolymer transport protein ExbB/TolQ
MLESESARLDSEQSMIRYIAWAIPALGFIGTVRGIGLALNEAHRAVEGDIAGVTENLGTAFNSTLIALLISIVVMFLVQVAAVAERWCSTRRPTWTTTSCGTCRVGAAPNRNHP